MKISGHFRGRGLATRRKEMKSKITNMIDKCENNFQKVSIENIPVDTGNMLNKTKFFYTKNTSVGNKDIRSSFGMDIDVPYIKFVLSGTRPSEGKFIPSNPYYRTDYDMPSRGYRRNNQNTPNGNLGTHPGFKANNFIEKVRKVVTNYNNRQIQKLRLFE